MKAKQTGFTLIELMFTIVVLAVLLGIGVPNFRDFIRNSRMTAAANDMLADFNLARSEAVKLRAPVTLCKSQDGASCDTGSAPFRRWIVFVDSATAAAVLDPDDPAIVITPEVLIGNGVVDDGELVLRESSMNADLRVGANGRLLVFRPSGFPNNGVAGSVSQIVLCDARGNNVSVGGVSAARAVTISPLGRATVTRDKTRITALGGCPG